MSNTSSSFDDRFIDLLIQRSTNGLSEIEQRELDVLSRSPENAAEAERYELTIAALNVALVSPDPEPMPRDVQDRVLLSAGSFFFEGENRDGNNNLSAGTSLDDRVELSERRSANRFSWREAVALAVAAACLMLLLSGYNPFATQPGLEEQLQTAQKNLQTAQEDLQTAQGDLQTVQQELQTSNEIALQRKESLDNLQAKVEELNGDLASVQKLLAETVPQPPAVLLQQFLDSKPADLVQLDWSPNEDKDASGQVYWSDELQEGYMVFSGLDVNDPKDEQYQLWIFDTDKNQPHPIDGGVFDIAAPGKVVVAMDPRNIVDKAVQFAITREKPGGVVLSDRKRLPLLASID